MRLSWLQGDKKEQSEHEEEFGRSTNECVKTNRIVADLWEVTH